MVLYSERQNGATASTASTARVEFDAISSAASRTAASRHASNPGAAARAKDLERLGEEIAELAAHLHAATYRLLVCLREFDSGNGWSGGFRNCAHWLSWRTGIGLGAAREKVRVARALTELPLLSKAMRQGELSFAKVRAATRVATPENEERLLELARHASASQLERVVRAWRRVDRATEQAEERERHATRELSLYVDENGMYVLRGRLDPEAGAALERALTAGVEALYGRAAPEDTSIDQRRADAVGLIAEAALRNGLTPEGRAPSIPPNQDARRSLLDGGRRTRDPAESGEDVHDRSGYDYIIGPFLRIATNGSRKPTVESQPWTLSPIQTSAELRATPASDGDAPAGKTIGRADRFQVVVHVDADALRESSATGQSLLEGGVRVSAETSRRLACDASRVVMRHAADGAVLDVGRRSRVVPAAIRRALDARDRGCRFPGCGLRHCDAHHVRHWADGGETRLGNLVLLCRKHHRLVHEEGWRMEIASDDGIRFQYPDGRIMTMAPPLPRVPADPVAAIAAAHRDTGLAISGACVEPFRSGERLDVDFAILTVRRGSIPRVRFEEGRALSLNDRIPVDAPRPR